MRKVVNFEKNGEDNEEKAGKMKTMKNEENRK